MAVPQHTIPETPPLAAVGMLSAAVLAYEILLMRLFAIVHWHHFAFMMISIALLGYGASGTLLMLLPSLKAKRLRTVFLMGTAGFSVACVVCFVAAQRLPFNALEVFWNPVQWGYLAGVYGLLFLPFFMAATSIGAALRFGGPRISQIYAADLWGAGIGAAVTAGLLFRLPPQIALVLVAGAGSAAAVLAAFRWQVRGRLLLTAAAAGWLILAGLGTTQWETVTVNAYKPLAQTLRMPDTRLLYEKHHPMGLFSAVQSPTIPFRYAPGLSLQSDTAIPDQIALFIDGQGMSVVDRYDGDPETLAYLRQTTVSVGLHLRPQANRVFIADAAGGQDILRAMAYGARRIDAVEPHPLHVQLLEHVQGLKHDRTLDPGGELEDLDALVVCGDRLLDMDLPPVQVVHGDETTLLLRSPDQLFGDITAVEPVVGGVDRVLPALAHCKRLCLSLHQSFQGGQKVGLSEDLPFPGTWILQVVGMGKEQIPGVPPPADQLPVRPDSTNRISFHRIPGGHFQGRRQHLGQAPGSILRQHHHESPRGAGSHGSQRSVRRRISESTVLKELGCGSRRCNAKGIDPHHLPRVGIVDEGLGLAPPTQDVPHGGRSGQHGAGRVHCVPPLDEDLGPGRSRHGLPCNGHPVLAVQDRFLGSEVLGPGGYRKEGTEGREQQERQPNVRADLTHHSSSMIERTFPASAVMVRRNASALEARDV